MVPELSRKEIHMYGTVIVNFFFLPPPLANFKVPRMSYFISILPMKLENVATIQNLILHVHYNKIRHFLCSDHKFCFVREVIQRRIKKKSSVNHEVL